MPMGPITVMAYPPQHILPFTLKKTVLGTGTLGTSSVRAD